MPRLCLSKCFLKIILLLFSKHASYNRGSGTYPNDIAVLKLYLEGRDTSRNSISVASSSDQFAGERCVISGWGQTGMVS